MTSNRVTVTELEEFLNKPPPGFSVKTVGSRYQVHSDPDTTLVLIDDFALGGRVVFQNSIGRKVKMRDLWEYSSMRKGLLSKKLCLLVSACEGNVTKANKKPSEATVLKRFVVSIDGNDPFIKWQLEKGLDWTISSVVGESYRVDIDLSDALESWAGKNLPVITDSLMTVKPVWRDSSFTLQYYSDALFDFPHWLGFSKRKFNLLLT